MKISESQEQKPKHDGGHENAQRCVHREAEHGHHEHDHADYEHAHDHHHGDNDDEHSHDHHHETSAVEYTRLGVMAAVILASLTGWWKGNMSRDWLAFAATLVG